jgi:hypothetical protein
LLSPLYNKLLLQFLRVTATAILVLPLAASAVTNSFTITATTTLTPLHTYFMAATGCNDADAGTSADSPWCTPNHAVVCGDVIVAAAGDYSAANLSSFGAVSSCPSTSGGIDGAGGIYFAVLLCGGSDLEACHSAGQTVTISTNNWAVEGFKVTGSGTTSRSFEANSCASGTTIIHHVAFINDISFNSKQGYDTNDCALNHNVPGNGTDYFAVVGSIAQNSAQDGVCVAAVDFVGPANFDAVAGTHAFINGNFAWANTSTACTTSDAEAFMADTLDAHGYTGQVVFSNNIAYTSRRYGFQLFYQAFNISTPTIKFYNNTSYNNLQNTGTDSADGEFNIAGGGPYVVFVRNNIALTGGSTSPGGGQAVYALVIGGGTWSAVTVGGSGNENIFKRNGSGSCAGTCDAGNNVAQFNSNSFGTNTYIDPAFTNTSDLITNQNGAPTCTGFENVTQCMGWNASTSTLTTPSIISDLTPTAGGTSGKGYQKPTMTCAANADYPIWLKGIVYLHWTGSIVQQRAGLVSVPCGV